MTISVPARPFEFPLKLENCALMIIDMQRDFVLPGGFGETLGNDVSPCTAIIPTLARLLGAFRAAGLPVIHTRECHQPDLSDCTPAKRTRGNPKLRIGDFGPMGRILIAGEQGADIVPELYPVEGESVINKPGKGAFYATALDELLKQRGIEQLILTGVTTEVCVQSTMREANDRGYEGLLVTDCTESYFPEFKQAAIDMIVAQGAIVGWATDSKTLLNAMEGTASD
ncbi:MAG: cysteine hydrolase [Hyphomicrobiales bacterium]